MSPCRPQAPLLFFLLVPLLAVVACDPPSPGVATGAEILWDEWGVPHLFAAGGEELFYAQGWAQARAHGDLLLRLYGRARGRGAEYWGEDELERDRWLRTMGVPERGAAWYDAQPPPMRALLDAFVAGVNDYAAAHPDALAAEVRPVLPVTGADVMAHLQQAVHFTFLARPSQVEAAAASAGEYGSNAWAIAPQRTAGGHALLVANPHLPWQDLFTWFELQMTAPGVDVYGATLVGIPFVAIGFNDHLAWTHTVNTHDGADLYELTLEGDGYRFDGEIRAFEVDEQSIAVRQADGSLRREPLTVERSLHGPVVARFRGRALALRVVGLDDPNLLEQYWEMARAENLRQFEAALRRMQMPMFTVIYADADGHVLHLFGGRTPVRPAGDWSWRGVVPGDTSATLWTETHPYDELPRVLDPASGWLQNANDPPWTTTFPRALDPEAFPPYMAPRFMHFRAQRSAGMLTADDSISFEEAVAYKHSTHMELADRLLDDLEAAVAKAGGDADPAARSGMEVLAAWDREADADSRGAVLFARFAERYQAAVEGEPFALPWNPDAARQTPDGFARPLAAIAALAEATREVEARWGAADIPWGEVYRLRLDDRDLPANGGPGGLGIFRVVGYRPDGEDRFRAAGGDSFVAVVELSRPPRAQALLTYGNWSQPGSPHRGDQLELFAAKTLRPVWRQRAEIEAHLAEREVLSP